MKKISLIILIVVLVIVGIWFFLKENTPPPIKPLPLDNIRENVVGSWKSLDDPKAFVTYNDNGTYRELYDGQEMRNGMWEMYAQAGDLSDNFLRTIDEFGDGTLEYAILEATDNMLTLSYLARGNTLRYEREIVSFEPKD
jgi:hypothetical protein